jgi:hypothetical protein
MAGFRKVSCEFTRGPRPRSDGWSFRRRVVGCPFRAITTLPSGRPFKVADKGKPIEELF